MSAEKIKQMLRFVGVNMSKDKNHNWLDQTPPPGKHYRETEDAARYLGISGKTLERLSEEGHIRRFSDRGRWRYNPDDLDALGSKISGTEGEFLYGPIEPYTPPGNDLVGGHLKYPTVDGANHQTWEDFVEEVRQEVPGDTPTRK